MVADSIKEHGWTISKSGVDDWIENESSYSSWDGHFYPKGTESKNYLAYYNKVFGYVEIDSSFYRIANTFMTKRWVTITPDNFRFTGLRLLFVTILT